jgi:glycerophosphoryl diester phosphodiesterase
MTRFAALLILSVTCTAVHASPQEKREGGARSASIVIAHRGASGYMPEHTLAGYFTAIQQGADYIEPDLVMTRDGVLVARHENEIGGTTDVAEHAEFAERRTTKTIDGVAITGWFTEDFTLAELKTLRARERIPELRPANRRFDGQFEVPTLDEVLALVEAVNEQRQESARRKGKLRGERIGVYPETKHPTYFDSIGLSMEEPLVHTLHRRGYVGKNEPVFIQSFEVGNLKDLNRLTRLRLIQLINGGGKPYDFVVANDPRTYADLVTADGLRGIAGYADGIGPAKDLIIPRNADGSLGQPTAIVQNAHSAGLLVHIFTMRAENTFLPTNFRSSANPADPGDLFGEIIEFLRAGVDGFFTDYSDIGVAARDAAQESP